MENSTDEPTQVISSAEREAYERRVRLQNGCLPSELSLENAEELTYPGTYTQLSRGPEMSDSILSDNDPAPVTQLADFGRFIEPDTPISTTKANQVTALNARAVFGAPAGNPFKRLQVGPVIDQIPATVSHTQLFQCTQQMFDKADTTTHQAMSNGAEQPTLLIHSPAFPPIGSRVALEETPVPLRMISPQILHAGSAQSGQASPPEFEVCSSPTKQKTGELVIDGDATDTTVALSPVPENGGLRERLSTIRGRIKPIHRDGADPTVVSDHLKTISGPTRHLSSSRGSADLPGTSQPSPVDPTRNGSSKAERHSSASTTVLLSRSSENAQTIPMLPPLPDQASAGDEDIHLHVADSQPLPPKPRFDDYSAHTHVQSRAMRSCTPTVPTNGSTRQSDEVISRKRKRRSSEAAVGASMNADGLVKGRTKASIVDIHNDSSPIPTRISPLKGGGAVESRAPLARLDVNRETRMPSVPDTVERPKPPVRKSRVVQSSPVSERDTQNGRTEPEAGQSDASSSRADADELDVGVSGSQHDASAEPAAQPSFEAFRTSPGPGEIMSQLKTFESIAGSASPGPDNPTLADFGISQSDDRIQESRDSMNMQDSPSKLRRARTSRQIASRPSPVQPRVDRDELEDCELARVSSPSRYGPKRRSERLSTVSLRQNDEVLVQPTQTVADDLKSKAQLQSQSILDAPARSLPTPVSSYPTSCEHQAELADDPFEAPVVAPDHAFAKFRGSTGHWYPAKVIKTLLSEQVEVEFLDGTKDISESRNIRQLILKRGDKVKIDVPGQRNWIYTVSSLGGQRVRTGLNSGSLCDARGWTSVLLLPAPKKTRQTVDEDRAESHARWVEVSSLYIPEGLKNQFASWTPLPPLTGLSDSTTTPAAPSTMPELSSSPLTTVRTSTPPSSSDSRAAPLFRKIAFCLSLPAEMRLSTERLIQDHGGHIISTDFQELFIQKATVQSLRPSTSDDTDSDPTTCSSTGSAMASEAASSLSMKPALRNYKLICLIVDTASRKPKYLQALALGIPCISHVWVRQCASRLRPLPWQHYLLSAGKSQVLGGVEKSQSLGQWQHLGVTAQSALLGRTRTLEGFSVIFIFAKRAEREKRKELLFIVKAMGAEEVHEVASMEEARSSAREHGAKRCLISVGTGGDGGAGEDRKALKPKVKRARTEANREDGIHGAQIVDDEWLKQTLILGAIIE